MHKHQEAKITGQSQFGQIQLSEYYQPKAFHVQLINSACNDIDSQAQGQSANPSEMINIPNIPNYKLGNHKVIYGAGKINTWIYFFVPFILLAPLISYYLAIKKHEQNPYPHPTITDTACHYPQDIEFRFFMAGSGSFLSLIYFVIFKWIKSQKQRIQYPGSIYSKIYYICQASVWGFMIAMGTIDGAWYPDLHTYSAVFFFIMLFILVMTHTLVLRDMYHWDSSVMSRKSYLIKSILAGYVGIVWIYTLTGLLTHPQSGIPNTDQNVWIVILEWNSVYICLFWLLSFTSEWKQLHFTLSQYTKQSIILKQKYTQH